MSHILVKGSLTYLSQTQLIQSFPKRQISNSSKLKEFADDNFNFNENGRKLPKLVENTEGKGEIAHYVQYLLFQQCFQKTCTEPGLLWERNPSHKNGSMKPISSNSKLNHDVGLSFYVQKIYTTTTTYALFHPVMMNIIHGVKKIHKKMSVWYKNRKNL